MCLKESISQCGYTEMKNKKLIIIFFSILAVTISTIFVILNQPGKNTAKPTDTTDDTNDSTGNETDNTNQPKPVETTGITQAQFETGLNSLVVNAAKNPSATASQIDRYNQIDFTKRFFKPVYNTKVTLFVASSTTKPSVLPSTAPVKNPVALVGKTSEYQQTAFIDSSASTVRWFSILKDTSITPAKYIWQVSLSPFKGSGGDQINPAGLLSSGDIAANASEFSIDFANAISIKNLSIRTKISTTILQRILILPTSTLGSSPVQKPYYVRVIPVDSKGAIIGDGGTGTKVIYGQSLTKAFPTRMISFRFDLQSPGLRGDPSFAGEFPNSFYYAEKRALDSTNGKQYYCFLPVGYATDATSLILQVSKVPFTASNWETAAGLVYQMKINAGEAAFDSLAKENPFKVDFTKFAPANSTLTNEEKINYYIRVVALKPATDVGSVYAYYSKTVSVEYGRPSASTIKIYDNKKVEALLPQVMSYSYTPVKWETSDWMYHYIVIRQPMESELFLGFGSTTKPYAPYTIGTHLDFTPHPEDKSWWEEVTDAISEFFSDVVGFVGDLTNWVASTYNSLKTGLIAFVAQNLPLIPDSLRDELQTVLQGLVDYGLASMGIPPTLPNFDQLTSMGTDYLATMAMESAGIPASDYLKDGLVDLGTGLAANATSSANVGGPNPFNWNFIKADPDYLYRPAYMLITLYNPYDVATPAGYISGSNQYIIDSTKVPLSVHEEDLYATFSGNVYYSTFKTVSGQKIPSLAPKQTLVIPIFLEELVGERIWTNGPKIDSIDFQKMYFNLGKFDFNFTLTYELPAASETAKAQGLPADAIYSYASTGSSISFTTEPSIAYSK